MVWWCTLSQRAQPPREGALPKLFQPTAFPKKSVLNCFKWVRLIYIYYPPHLIVVHAEVEGNGRESEPNPKFLGTFPPTFWLHMTKKGPKVSGGKQPTEKCPKSSKIPGGGVIPGLENTQIKAAFSFVGCPLFVNSQFVATIMLYEVVFSQRSDLFLIF